MYKPLEIKENLFYVGVNDRTKHLFENVWPLPYGVSYNSYIINDDKIVLVDTVDICYSDVYFKKIEAVIGNKPIDYLIVNHMEPDHSGSIEWLITKYPNIKLIGNKRTVDMLAGYYGISNNVVEIKDSEELNIGKIALQFHLTPMVHWPETMMTYAKEIKTLFSADAFGTFGTLDGGVLDTQLIPERYDEEMVRYYSNIVGKYGSPVQAALKKLAGVPLDAICSTHGPVWTDATNIGRVVATYDKLSSYQAEDGLVIAYGSMYGHTEQLAEIIAAEAAACGVKNIVMHNVSKSDLSYIIKDVFKYKGLIIGSPTYNNKLYSGVESLLSALENRLLKNRFFGSFGSFTWADATAKNFKAFAQKMELETISAPVVMKQGRYEDAFENAKQLARTMADKLLSGAEVVPNNEASCH